MVQALLRQTNLWEHRNKPLGSFSGGMKQRFGIAQALLGNPRLIIVDEPTAGLDPEERVRFHNLLSAIGENVIVILSTHIVSDVSDLCRNMAIIHQGRVQAAGDPAALVAELNGRVWKKAIARSEVPDYQQRFRVISMRLFAGRTLLHVLQDELPEPGFEPVVPDLEDLYFATIRGSLGELTHADQHIPLRASTAAAAHLDLRLLRRVLRAGLPVHLDCRAAPSPAPASSSAPAARCWSIRRTR